MGVSTDGQLNYGICFEAEFEFPWSDEIEEWWMNVNGFKNPNPSPFDEKGNWKNGVEDNEAYEIWIKAKNEWQEKNPLPIEIEIHCSYDYPMYLMKLPETGYYNNRGFPKKINPNQLNSFDTEKAKSIIIDFCNKYEIENDFEFGWWLTSLWG